jgi:gamma-glutamyltranspeptidase/glutathione hydrolase
MITAPQPEAVEAGTAILRAGGNALDAVIACALTQGVVDPMMCGLGGLGVLHLLDTARGVHTVVDGLSVTPMACRADMWADRFEGDCPDGFGYIVRDNLNELGHSSVTVPGIMRVLGQAHAQYGRTGWASLFDPAIGHAEEGWLVRPHVATMFYLDEQAYGRRSYLDKLAFTDNRKIGVEIIRRACEAPLRQIAVNAADEFDLIGCPREEPWLTERE